MADSRPPLSLSPDLAGAVAVLRRRFGEGAVRLGVDDAELEEGVAAADRPTAPSAGMRNSGAEAPPRRATVWPTGIPALDTLTPLGGLPRGRLVVLSAGTPGATGRLTLLQALLAVASRTMPVAYVDLAHSLDPGFLADLGARLEACLVARPPDRSLAQGLTMARVLISGGVPWVGIALGPLPMPREETAAVTHATSALVGTAARTGAMTCLSAPVRLGRPLAYAASLVLRCFPGGWQESRGDVVGLRVRVQVTKSRVCAPGGETTLLLRYPRPYATAEVIGLPVVVASDASERVGEPGETTGGPCSGRSAGATVPESAWAAEQ